MITAKNCCCCISLRTGCLILGWTQVITQSLNLLSAINFTFNNCTSGIMHYTIFQKNLFWPMIVITIIRFLTGVSLLKGVYSSHKKLVFWYLLVEGAILVFIFTISTLFLTIGVVGGVEAFLAVFAAEIVILSFLFHLLVVVYSYFIKMKDDDLQPVNQTDDDLC